MITTKLLNECIGTFFLTAVVAFTGNPLAIGAVLMVLVYSGAHISGAHYNPAVTLGMLLKNKISRDEGLSYIAFQFLGALGASLLYFLTHPTYFLVQPAADASWAVALVIEICFTFLLVRTIYMVTDSRVKGNQYFGLAIGGALLVGAVAGGPISGGAFNPAVGIAPLLLDFRTLHEHLPLAALYLFGPLLGTLGAAYMATEKK